MSAVFVIDRFQDLSDVDMTQISAGQVLIWTGTKVEGSPAGGAGVSSFNTRTGDVSLLAADINSALSAADLGVGNASPQASLHIIRSAGTVRVESSSSDNTNKAGKFIVGHYINAEEPMLAFQAQSDDTNNSVFFGGGDSNYNAASRLRFFTAADRITPTGTERLTITGAGLVGINQISPTNYLHITGSQPSSVASTPGVAATGMISITGGTGGDTTITTTGVGGVGGNWTLTSGNGGQASGALVSSTGGAGGQILITPGLGGAAAVAGSGNNTGGAGGEFRVSTATGGAASGVTSGANAGGAGGAITMNCGTGGAASNGATNQGGTGGVWTMTGGQGGAGAIAGSGGAINITAGTGGAGTTTSGSGGNVNVTGGSAGATGTPGTGGTVNILGGAAASAAGSAGGPVVLQGRAGSSTGTGGAGGSASLIGGNAGGDQTVARAGGGITLTPGNARGNQGGAGLTLNSSSSGDNPTTGTATGPTGGAVSVNAGAGGTANLANTSSTGGAGGQFSLNGGAGGTATVATGTNTGGVGGALSFSAGAGGTASGGSSNIGGAGGTVTISGGSGGVGDTGGNGGALTVRGGAAPASPGAAGGNATLSGRGGSTTGSGGDGGSGLLLGGNAGGDGSVARAGGQITVTCGNSIGNSAGRTIFLNPGLAGNNPATGTATGPIGGRVDVGASIQGTGGSAPNATVASTGGAGGAINLRPGNGGVAGVAGTGTNTGGAGGAIAMTGGSGGVANGASSGTNTGGAGGAVTIDGGVGGVASVGSGTLQHGAGGAVQISGGRSGGANGLGGAIIFSTTPDNSAVSERLRITPAGLVTFGGTSSSFPALKRSSAELQVRLADDSAFAALQALSLTLTNALTVANGGTGLQSATAFSVICGGTTGTGAFQSVSGLGSSGQILTSNGAGQLPTWQDAAGGFTLLFEGTNVIEQRNGTNSQDFNVYNTYSGGGSDYERLRIGFGDLEGTDTVQIYSEKAGSGADKDMAIKCGGTLKLFGSNVEHLRISSSNIRPAAAGGTHLGLSAVPFGEAYIRGPIVVGDQATTSYPMLKRNSATLEVKLGDDSDFTQLRIGSLGVKNSASATSLGSVVKKIEVFSEAGTSLGFVPVYDSIT